MCRVIFSTTKDPEGIFLECREHQWEENLGWDLTPEVALWIADQHRGLQSIWVQRPIEPDNETVIVHHPDGWLVTDESDVSTSIAPLEETEQDYLRRRASRSVPRGPEGAPR